MSKVLNVENGNYIVKVEPGQNIILDTSRGQVNADNELIGEVIINGQLNVKGKTTTIKSTDLQISDNIIVLNHYDLPAGIDSVVKGMSGIEVDRGEDGARTRWVYDESLVWTTGGTVGQGTWKAERDDHGILPIHTNGITTPNTHLFIDTGSNVISTSDCIDYKTNIFNYNTSGEIEDPGTGPLIYGDGLPNAQAVVDYIDWAFANVGSGSILEMYDTTVIVYDFEFDGDPSRIELSVDGILKVKVDEFGVTFPGLNFTGTTITPVNALDNLELKVYDGKTVVVNRTLDFIETPMTDDPVAPLEGIRMYSKTEGPGDTGLYYINKSETQDELISRNRSLVFSMLF